MLVSKRCSIKVTLRYLRKSRIALFTLLVLYISAYGMWIMFDILNSNSMTLLEYALLALFSITFTWIVTAFCSGCMGFILQLLRIDHLTLKRRKRLL